MLKLFPRRGQNPGQWKELTVKAVDKVTLTLPERPRLFKKFGAHRGCRGLGPVSVELCCVFAVLRLVYVYRKGFRRRRILTNLLDPDRYPSHDLAALYHRRWDIETFYRDFKETMQARTWHCQTPDTFEKELTMHMIAVVLIRNTMLEAARSQNLRPARLSFCRALTEARVFLRRIGGAVFAVVLRA